MPRPLNMSRTTGGAAGVLACHDHACEPIERPALAVDGVADVAAQCLVVGQQRREDGGASLSDRAGRRTR